MIETCLPRNVSRSSARGSSEPPVAFELSRRGAHVTVLDSRTLAAGATQASAGLLAPYTEAHGGGRAVRSHRPRAGRLRRVRRGRPRREPVGSSTVAPARWKWRTRRSGWTNCARVSVEPWAARAGLEWLDAAGLRARAPTSVRMQQGGCGAPLTDTWRSRRLWMRSPTPPADPATEFQFAREVDRAIEPSTGTVRVVAAVESQTFDRVVLCAGAWTPALDPLGHDEGTHHADPRSARATGRATASSSRTPLGRILLHRPLGGRNATGRRDLGGCGVRRACDAGRRSADCWWRREELVPALASASFQGVRVGLRPGTADGLPILGPSPDPRILYAAGHFRNGILLAPLTAQLIANYVFAGAVDPAFSAA